jgi:hypothetical protein
MLHRYRADQDLAGCEDRSRGAGEAQGTIDIAAAAGRACPEPYIEQARQRWCLNAVAASSPKGSHDPNAIGLNFRTAKRHGQQPAQWPDTLDWQRAFAYAPES